MRNLTTRKAFGALAAAAAMCLTIPTGIALADDPTTEVKPPRDPEGPGCDAYKAANPTGPAAFPSMAKEDASVAIANNPDLSTFSQAISGQLNPAVNVAAVLDNGPYVVFAPTNEAFAKLPAAQLENLKTNADDMYSVVFYHMALGLLTPKNVEGKMTSQEGRQLTIVGDGGNITVDDVAKVVCGGITAKNAQIYMIDTVLDPSGAQPTLVTTAPETTEAEETETTESEAEDTEATETETAETEATETETAETEATETDEAGTEATVTETPAGEDAETTSEDSES